jgi:hypothetical protein
MLKSPVYCGLIAHKGKVYKGSFTGLVSEELWQSVQDSGRKKAVPKKTVDDSFPLRGFVKCGHCRAKLTAGNAKGRNKAYPRYWCWNRECSKPVSVDRAKPEADWLGFLEHMQPAFDALVNVLPVLAKSNAQKRIERVDQRQRHLATQLSEKKALHLKLIEAKLRGELRPENFEAMRDALAKDIAEIESAQHALIQFLFLLALSPVPALAQLHTLEVSQYVHTSWTSQEGFFRAGISAINSVTQTSDGYVWVAGSGGIFRFDGVRFTEWKPPVNEALPRRPLHRLLASRDGSLWIAGFGLAELRANGEFRRYHELDGVETESGLIEDNDGGIWAGGAAQPQSSKLCRFYRGASECFPAAPLAR